MTALRFPRTEREAFQRRPQVLAPRQSRSSAPFPTTWRERIRRALLTIRATR